MQLIWMEHTLALASKRGITVPFPALHLTRCSHTSCAHRKIASPLCVHPVCWPNIFWWIDNCFSVWSIPGKIKVLAQSVTSGTTDRNYCKWQKYREWEYIWRNTNNCMNIHYKNMTLWGFLNIILRHHITWGVVFEWVMVITDCCKLKPCVICSLTE